MNEPARNERARNEWVRNDWDFGRNLSGWAWPAERPRAAALLTHGYAEHTMRYLRLIDALVADNVSVFAYDQRGHGESPGPRALFTADGLLDDHLAARRDLRVRLQGVPLFLVGHSLGGAVTALSVLRDDRDTRGVVLSSPALQVGTDQPVALRVASRVLGRVTPALETVELDSGTISRLPEVVRDYDADPHVYHGRIKAGSGLAMMQAGERVLARADAWTLPTLVIHGTDDRLIPVEGSRQFAKNISSRDRELWEVPGGYHELFNDIDGDRATRKVVRWIADRV